MNSTDTNDSDVIVPDLKQFINESYLSDSTDDLTTIKLDSVDHVKIKSLNYYECFNFFLCFNLCMIF